MVLAGVDDLLELLDTKGATWYGSENVSQRDHALQCATLAERAGSSDALIAACLLHDVGHLVSERPHTVGRDTDDVHQYVALQFMRGMFCDDVLEPIRLHVDAKRYLCQTEFGYWNRLSAASRHSLELQGGALDASAAPAFRLRPYSSDALRLRRWDDQAKQPGRTTPPLEHFEQFLRRARHAAGRTAGRHVSASLTQGR